MSPITALGHWDIFFRPEERVPPTGLPTPLPAASGLPSRDWPGPTLLSFRSKPAVVCRVVCCWHPATQELCIRFSTCSAHTYCNSRGLNPTKTALDTMEHKAFTISSWNIQGLPISAFGLKNRNQDFKEIGNTDSVILQETWYRGESIASQICPPRYN